MTSNDTWLTLAQASNRHGKSIATIRRWITLHPVTVRTELRQGTRYVHEDDIAKVAAAFPPPIPAPERAACAEAGHQPDQAAITALGLGGTVEWLSLGEAGRITARSKSTLTLWIKQGEVRAVHCSCKWRRFVWTPDLEAATTAHPHRKGTTRD
jgi:predicted site-specific integrase-resolvase